VCDEYLMQFDPLRDSSGSINESEEDYIQRMRPLLPEWPDEVLIEWLYRHNTGCDRYAHLGFENFRFRNEEWEADDIPGKEAFWDPKFCDNFKDVERRSEITFPEDWLARYMIENGTWNTPPVILENVDGSIAFSETEMMKSPYHLLEGHRRLSFLNGLKEIGKALENHAVWVVTLVSKA